MSRRSFAIGIGVVAATWFGIVGTASGAGGPIVPGPAFGSTGVASPDGADRYVTLFAGREPAIARIQQDGGEVLRSGSFGHFAIPAVTVDGSAGGLSADGSTLVLASSRWGLQRTESRFKIVDAPRLRVRKVIELDGSFTFDAISPDASRIYLIEYPSPRDTTRYSVRAVDTRSGRLLPDPIVDPNEPPGEMRGYPLKRVTSPDGRWAYTLYDGSGEHPFIHALDTVEGRAVCIDLHEIGADTIGRLQMTSSADGAELTLADRKSGPVALVDTQTFEVSSPSKEDGGGGFPWVLVVAGAVAGLAAWALAHALRRRRRVAPGGAQ
jgi:hypothetical protein